MGANSKQGWLLFIFIIGFTFLVAGVAYLGPLFTLVGLVALVASLIGFHQIKPLEYVGEEEKLRVVTPSGQGSKHSV